MLTPSWLRWPASVFASPLKTPMDRTVVFFVLLLVGLTWLLYNLTVRLRK